MLLTILPMLVAVAPPAPPPPPVIPTVPVIVGQPDQPRTLAFDVAVTRDGRPLWSGTLLMSSSDGASFLQQSEQTLACDAPDRPRGSTARFTERLRIMVRTSGYPRDRIRVTAEWQRLAASIADLPALCTNAATRTVSVESDVSLAGGGPVTLRGDAGLEIVLRPR